MERTVGRRKFLRKRIPCPPLNYVPQHHVDVLSMPQQVEKLPVEDLHPIEDATHELF